MPTCWNGRTFLLVHYTECYTRNATDVCEMMLPSKGEQSSYLLMCEQISNSIELIIFDSLSKNCEINCVFPSVLSVWNNSVSTGRIFFKFGSWVFSEYLPRKNNFSLEPKENNVCNTWRPIYSYFISLSSSYSEQDRQCTYNVTMRRVRATIVIVEKQ
jgi:hypothetical protein